MPHRCVRLVAVVLSLTGGRALELRAAGAADVTACPAQQGQASLCADGKHLPELWLLGVQKSGSTALTSDLLHTGIHKSCTESGVTQPAGTMTQKSASNASSSAQTSALTSALSTLKSALLALVGLQECYSLALSTLLEMSTPSFLHSATLTGMENMLWKSQLPACPPGDRTILGDFSVTNFNPAVPRLLREFYCNGAHQRLTFMVILRDPIKRMQSQWYYSNRTGPKGIYFNGMYLPMLSDCSDCTHATFQEDLLAFLDRYKNKRLGVMERLIGLSHSMYADVLQSWLSNFDASQFIVIPNKFYRRENRTLVCTEVRRRLRYAMDCGKFFGANVKKMGSHPEVTVDLSVAAQSLTDQVMRPEIERLARLLADAQSKGLTLVGSEGSGPSMVQSYLEANW